MISTQFDLNFSRKGHKLELTMVAINS